MRVDVRRAFDLRASRYNLDDDLTREEHGKHEASKASKASEASEARLRRAFTPSIMHRRPAVRVSSFLLSGCLTRRI